MSLWFESRVIRKLNLILQNQELIMSALEDLTVEVTADVASIQAAITALGNTSSDTAALVALTAQLASARSALDAAVTAHSS